MNFGKYDEQIREIERKKDRAIAKAQAKALSETITANIEKPIRIVHTQVLERSEGGYTGDEIRTDRVDVYTVYLGDTKIKEYRNWYHYAVGWVNETFFKQEQVVADRRLKYAKRALEKATRSVELAEAESRRLKGGVVLERGHK